MRASLASDSRLASLGSRTISASYSELEERFLEITLRARSRFDGRDWLGMRSDALERLRVYSEVAIETADQVGRLLGERLTDKEIWTSMKALYSAFAMVQPDFELAETFFNSITRRTFATVGVDPRIEFVDTDFVVPPTRAEEEPFRTYEGDDGFVPLLTRAIADAGFDEVPGVDGVATNIANRLPGEGGARLDLASLVFYRGKGAYLVGRAERGDESVPMAIALEHRDDGVVIDALLLSQVEVSTLFSFAHSYFHVATRRPYELVRFVNELVPRKRHSELYISLGHARHGKTELFRELLRHMETTGDVFVEAEGKEGLVMSVFTLPGFEMVLKVIKDTFPVQKTMTPRQVMDKYKLVFHHDRAGRLVDSQSFEHLGFKASRFDPALLERLLETCSRTLRRRGDTVEIDLAYMQRRVEPLDVFLKRVQVEEAAAAVVDYGNAIKDLAVTGIFPGDLLIKNFGVTRNGRVVFYDYDELTEMSEPNFREMPVASSFEDEMAETPWFGWGPDDVFPAEFASFLGLSGELRETFVREHGDIFEARWWQSVQRRLAEGEVVSIYPYAEESRVTA